MERKPRIYAEWDQPMDPVSVARRARRRRRLTLFGAAALALLFLVLIA